MKTWTEKG